MKRFEYHIFKLGVPTGWFGGGGKADTDLMDKRINEFGSDGWELVSSLDTNETGGGTRDIIFIFKREKQD